MMGLVGRWGLLFRDDMRRMATYVARRFGRDILMSPTERADRILEEAVELHQAVYTKHSEAHFGIKRAKAIVDYSYTRPPGEITQEIAGVIFTTLTLAYARGEYAIDTAIAHEIDRVWKIDPAKLAQKRAYKFQAGISDFGESSPDTMADIEDRSRYP